jgi:hypothetical protein
MDTYAYLNAVLDANPTVTKLVLATDAYGVATGPVPPGETDLASRVTLEAQPNDAVPNMSEGYDAANALVVRFFC